MIEVYPEQSNLIFDGEGNPALDRAVGEAFMLDYHKSLYANGGLPNDMGFMQVFAGGGLKLSINGGLLVINGRFGRSDDITEMTLTSSPLAETKYLIVFQYSKANRMWEFVAKKDKFSYTDIVRTGDIIEAGLAVVTVPQNATQITQANILNVRFDSRFCGVSAGILQVDTTGLFIEFETALNEFLELAEIKTAEILALIGGLQTQTFAITRASFDANWDKLGCERTTEIIRDVNGITSSAEKITVIADDFVLATRDTTITRVNGLISSSVSNEIWNSYQFVNGLITTIIPSLVFGVTTDITRVDGEITGSREVIL